MKRSLRKTGIAALVAAFGLLTGCAVAVRPVETDLTHPANPRAAVGTATPKDFPLMPTESVNPTSPASSDSPATHTHHHDS
jgi:hypothetical protein